MPYTITVPASERHTLLLQEEKKSIRWISLSELNHAAFYASMFLVPKPNRTFCPILNVSSLNVFIDCPHIKMETGSLVHEAVCTSDWTCSIERCIFPVTDALRLVSLPTADSVAEGVLLPCSPFLAEHSTARFHPYTCSRSTFPFMRTCTWTTDYFVTRRGRFLFVSCHRFQICL